MRFLPSDNWQRDWPTAQPYITSALARGPGGATEDDVVRFLEAGEVLLWLGPNCAMVTDCNRPALSVWFAAGDIDGINTLAQSVVEYAKVEKYQSIMIYGRKGWEFMDVVKDLGFRHKWTVLEMKLWGS